MPSYTHYLTTTKNGAYEIIVRIIDSSPVTIAQGAINSLHELKYSPIMPAFLEPGEGPPPPPATLETISFLFSNAPYKAFLNLKGVLKPDELSRAYFTEGLASVVLANFQIDRVKELRKVLDPCPFEFWRIKDGRIDLKDLILEIPTIATANPNGGIILATSDHPELRVYVEQISASLASLWVSYNLYFPEERETLQQIALAVEDLIKQHVSLTAVPRERNGDLIFQKKSNSIISALVEISAALSYAVTQGTSGALPILSNRSPFPHHSLLGIGGAIRALTKYTRYLEAAFVTRSAEKVIKEQYAILKHTIPVSIPQYNSGAEHKVTDSSKAGGEHFDHGGDFRQDDQIPLITHFSLRHGFMESKFSVTAASEALTAETLPQWTLMTLSHEIMHSRVRTIFQALFGKNWDEPDNNETINVHQFDSFTNWYEGGHAPQQTSVVDSLRNIVLLFCHAIEKYKNPDAEEDDKPGQSVPMEKIVVAYSKHKQFAIEILVHFHDFYFVYACQRKMYVMSLWASWIKVAAPYARPREYLTRCLATIACGTGLPCWEAFNYAKEIFAEGLEALEIANVSSPLFGELRQLLQNNESEIRSYFYPCYYLIDNIRLFFASKKIAEKIDRIENDPFAEGSTSVDDYTANIYVFAENAFVSPIRYSLATLFKTLTNQSPINDPQWLTAWNYMVISSQEISI